MLKNNKNKLKYQLREKKYRMLFKDMQQEIHTTDLKHDELKDETHKKKPDNWRERTKGWIRINDSQRKGNTYNLFLRFVDFFLGAWRWKCWVDGKLECSCPCRLGPLWGGGDELEGVSIRGYGVSRRRWTWYSLLRESSLSDSDSVSDESSAA